MIRCVLILFFLTGCFSSLAIDYERFRENGKVGLKDKQGIIIIPASFDALGWSDGNFSVIGQITGYRQNNKWGLINLKKKFITKPDYNSLTWPGGDRIIISKFLNPYTIKFGALDLLGKLVIPFSYDAINIQGLHAIVMIKNGIHYEYGVVDLDDHSIIPVRYKKITSIGTLRYAVQNFYDKTALCNEQGKWITDFIIDEISDFHHNMAIITQGWRQGIIDRNGEIKIQPSFRAIHIISPEQLSVRKANEWKLLDINFKEIQKIEADDLYESNGLYHLSIGGKEGITDDQLQPQWPTEYNSVEILPYNQVILKKNGKSGLYRTNHTTIIPIVFDSLCVQKNFVRCMQWINGKASWEVYDTFGIKKSRRAYEFVDRFNGKFFPVKIRGFFGAVDRYGEEKIACVYDSILEVNDSLVSVIFKKQYGIITIEDRWKVIPQKNPLKLLADNHYLEKQDTIVFLKDIKSNTIYFTDQSLQVFNDHLQETLADGTVKEINFLGKIISRKEPVIFRAEQIFRESEGYTGIKRDGKFGFVDSHGRLRIANRYEAIGEFHDGLAPIKLLGKWGYINAADQIMIQPTYESCGDFDNRIAQICRKGKKGLINAEGKELLELRYDSIKKISNQLFLLTLNSLKGLASSTGRMLIEPRFESLEVLENNQVVVSQNKQYGVLTTDGLSVLPISYSKIIYLPEKKMFLVEQKALWETLEMKE